jgi:predicted nucleic acid-binding protein
VLHTFVDTNVFLSLYAYTDDNIEELRKLLQLLKTEQLKLYVTTVVNQEFNRNRDKKIQESLGNLEKFNTTLSIPRFAEHIEEVATIRAALADLKKSRASLLTKVTEEINERRLAADLLFKEIREASKLVAISDDADRAARRRLELGNPPGKDGDLADRFNWEALLEKVPDGNDIHVVSRDKDYASPFGESIPHNYLFQEWEVIKKGKMFLYPGLRAFAKARFPEIHLATDVEKKFAIKQLIDSTSFADTHAAIARLAPFSADLASDEAEALFSALIHNPCVHEISSKDDVKAFYESLLVDHWKVLSGEEYSNVTQYVEDPVPF